MYIYIYTPFLYICVPISAPYPQSVRLHSFIRESCLIYMRDLTPSSSMAVGTLDTQTQKV